jgi:asparagine synthase (glutamine-hydrolysing)
MARAPARSGLDRAQYADLTFWLPGDILTKVDRASMAASLEAREPLLDHRLVEFAARLPESLRIRRGQGKWLMKQAMRRRTPQKIVSQIACNDPSPWTHVVSVRSGPLRPRVPAGP